MLRNVKIKTAFIRHENLKKPQIETAISGNQNLTKPNIETVIYDPRAQGKGIKA